MRIVSAEETHRLLDYPSLVEALRELFRRGVDRTERAIITQPLPDGRQNVLLKSQSRQTHDDAEGKRVPQDQPPCRGAAGLDGDDLAIAGEAAERHQACQQHRHGQAVDEPPRCRFPAVAQSPEPAKDSSSCFASPGRRADGSRSIAADELAWRAASVSVRGDAVIRKLRSLTLPAHFVAAPDAVAAATRPARWWCAVGHDRRPVAAGRR